jgi:phage tail-like protein
VSGGWLTAQLPRVIEEDPVLSGIVRIVEDIADSYRSDLDAVPEHLDIAAAAGPMLRYLASWVGADLDPSISPDRQREVLRAVGPLLGWRGTRRGLEGILEALTGARVQVEDSGGVWAAEDQRPAPSPLVVVELEDLGELSPGQVRAYVGQEVPVGTTVELRLRGRALSEGDRDDTGG